MGAYGLNFFRSPLARPCTHFAASATTTTLLSLAMTLAKIEYIQITIIKINIKRASVLLDNVINN